ncbi:MAG: Receptor family ligand binding region [Candidatus Accumulibacter sp. BA-94]|nr:MAG: Receptor family ligand binding region [Candidatus Accumulibacter sp. BA-94]
MIAEDKVDVIIGSTITPNSLAMTDVVAEAETPMIAMAASARIIDPIDAKRHWVFKTPPNDAQMATAIVERTTNNKVKTGAYFGFADAYGEGWWNEFSKIGEARKIKIVGNERFNRSDSSVTGQVLKILSAKPDAVPVGGAAVQVAQRQGLQGNDVSEARCGQRRLSAGLRQRLRRNFPACRFGAGSGAVDGQ